MDRKAAKLDGEDPAAVRVAEATKTAGTAKAVRGAKPPKKRRPSFYRSLVFFAFLVVVAVGYFTTFGIGNLSAIGWDAWSVICPLGYLESLLAGKVFVPRALISFICVVALIVVLGRVFCSWICPMPHLQRWIPGKDARKKKAAKKAAKASANKGAVSVSASAGADAAVKATAGLRRGKPNRFALDSRYGVLVGALASAAIFGFPVFCLICPVGLTFATVLLVMRLFSFGEATWTVIVVPAILIAEVALARKWCHRFCPLGAVISLVSGANKTLRPTIDDKKCLVTSKHTGCYTCSAVCPEHIDIRRSTMSPTSLNNCTKCRECAFACPAHAITYPFLSKDNSNPELGPVGAPEAGRTEDAEEVHAA